MTIKKLCKQLFLFSIFFTLVLQLGSAISWFTSSPVTESVAKHIPLATELPLGLTPKQIQKSLAQFTSDGIITPDDIKDFLASAARGAEITYLLFFNNQEPIYSSRKSHLLAIADLISFFYLIAMLSRDDGLMPADVTFGIVDHGNRFKHFTKAYLDRIRNHKKLDIGSEQNIFGTNPLAYFRQQSHGFIDAWGLNIYLNKKQPSLPLLFTGRWPNSERCCVVTGPLYHLLAGTDPHQQDKLYLKPEECGIYHWGEWFGHTKGYLKVIGRRTPLINRFLDADDEPQFNKERLPREVLSYFKACMRAHNTRLSTPQKEAIRRGIAGIYTYAGENGWSEFTDFIETHFNLPHHRRGNEIIIAPETAIWATYFISHDQKVRTLFDALITVKRALGSSKPADIRTSIRNWKKIYVAQIPNKIIKNQAITNYLEKLSTRFDTLTRMNDLNMEKFVARYRRQIFA